MDDKYYQNNHLKYLNDNPNLNKEENHNNYISNYLDDIISVIKKNIGKLVTIYYSNPNSIEWHDKELIGIIEKVGYDHIILSDPKTGEWLLLLNIYLNYIKFSEIINN